MTQATTAEAPETTTPLTDDATADEITAAQDRHRQAAESARDRAGRDRADAEALRAAAKARAEEIIAEAEAAARPLDQAAAIADKEDAGYTEMARRLGLTAGAAKGAEEAERKARDLGDERDRLAGERDDFAGRLAKHAADRRDAEAALAAAIENEDGEGMNAARGKIANADALADAVRAKMTPVAARLAELGTGAENSSNHPYPLPVLATARQAAAQRRRSVREGLNYCWPDRPEAADDRRRAEFVAVFEAQGQRLAEEAAAARQPVRRMQVRQG